MKSEFRSLRDRAARGWEHIFLKDALAETCDATTVEAGNVFSPGAWTCGISVVWQGESGWQSVEDLPLEPIQWRFEDGERSAIAPVLRAQWQSGNATFVHRLTHLGGVGATGVDYATVEVGGLFPGKVGILVRDIGPAGGHISALVWDEAARVLEIGQGPRLFVESAPDAAQIWPADDDFAAPAALLWWDLNAHSTSGHSTSGQGGFELRFRVEHHFGERPLGELGVTPSREPKEVETGFVRAVSQWEDELRVRINALKPEFRGGATSFDERIGRMWEMCSYHLLAAAEAGLPRIGALNYPHLWLRDGVLVARAFDLMGRSDLARRGCEEIAPQIFAGGFGAESDAPGQGIWALVSHARQTEDFGWLEEQWPHIKARLTWIEAMMNATTPLRAVGTGRIPGYLDTPAINVVCLPAQNGCIAGRMDWHAPDFFINCWSVRGLRDGACAAQWRGDERGALHWEALANRLERAAFEHLLPRYGNERDPIITPYPSETLTGAEFLPVLREHFAAWLRANRLDETGERRREPLWTYFEVAQIHNAFRLGLHREAWTCLDALLNDELEIGAFPEGTAGGNEFLPFGNGSNRRGWLNAKTARAGNMPHGWTCAEMINLLHFVGEPNG